MRRQALGLMVVAMMISTAAEGRQWTDSSGRYRRDAELVKFEDGKVWFTDAQGASLVVDFDRLSAADQEFVIGQQGKYVGRSSSPKPGPVVTTLVLRTAKTAARSDSSPPDNAAGASLFRMIGWSHCPDGHCYYHHPHPYPPHPPAPPLPVPGKRIYYGCWSTWHLVLQTPNAISGTGTYLVSVGPTVVRHLVLLRYVGNNGTYLHYRAEPPLPAGGIPHWRFANVATGSCWYEVQWSMDGVNWYFYEYCQVKLPL